MPIDNQYLRSITGPQAQVSGSDLARYPTWNFGAGITVTARPSHPRLDIELDDTVVHSFQRQGNYLCMGADGLVHLTGSTGDVVQARGRDYADDGGQGTLTWDDDGVHDGVFVFGKWRRLWHKPKEAWAGWAGVKQDVKYVYDAVRTSGSLYLDSVSASFSARDIGKRVLINEPSQPCSGTAAIVAGSHNIVGTGTNFLSIERESFDNTTPRSGGCMWIGGQMYVVRQILSDTSMVMFNIPASSVSGQVVYAECQTEATIVDVVSETRCLLDVPAVVSMTGLTVAYGTDDDDALDRFEQACFDNDIEVLRFPPGHIGVYRNHTFGANATDPLWQSKRRTNMQWLGAGYDRTVFSRLRRVSWAHDSLEDFTAYPGGLAWELPIGVEVNGVAYTDNVPSLGVIHSTAGIENGSGGRIGFCMRHPTDSGYVACGGYGFCSRDEYLYMESAYAVTGNYFRDIYVPMANNNAINNNGSLFRFTTLVNCDVGSFFSSYQIDGDDLLAQNLVARGQMAIPNGNNNFLVSNFSSGLIDGLTIMDVNNTGYNVGALQVFTSFDGPPDAQLRINNVQIRNIKNGSGIHSGSGGVIDVQRFRGTLRISNVQMKEISSSYPGGKYFNFYGNTGDVILSGVDIGSGSHAMDHVIDKSAMTGGGRIFGQETVRYNGSNIVSFTNDGTMQGFACYQNVSGSGTAALGKDVSTFDVSFSGSCTVQLPSPLVVPPGWIVSGCNSSGTLGTTTVTTAAGSLVGANTMVGSGSFASFVALGSTWRRVA